MEVKENAQRNARNKKKFKILGISVWRALLYFIIYSIVGYIIETIFGLVTKGVLESRKSFLYGPFCSIYGIGAVIMILGLQYFKKNNYSLFFGGFLIGSIVEYIISWIGEFIFHIKWWDYSNMAFNLNGRICVAFSLFWGVLAIYLMTHFNPLVDRLIDKIPKIYIKTVAIIGITIIIVNCLITAFALKMFFARLVQNNNLELQSTQEYLLEYTKLYNENEKIRKITDRFFSDEKMLKTFPNIKVTGKNGEIIFISDILNNIQPYYFRLFTPKHIKEGEYK